MIVNSMGGIVLTAQSFNPSIFTETWLEKNTILDAGSLVGLRVFSPDVAQFQTNEVQVLVLPPKMQISFPLMPATGSLLPRRIASRIVELLPHTPCQALGLNFDYFVSQPPGQSFGAYNKELLGSGNYALLQEFATEDSKFGRYFSKNFGSARLRLDIKPVRAGPENTDLLQFSFNFHHDLLRLEQADRAAELVRLIGTWDSLREYSQNLVEIGSDLRK